MSRSFKKTPGSGDTSNKFMKRYFNRKIRQTPVDDETTLQYGKYKKFSNSWEIKDYYWVDPGFTFEKFKEERIAVLKEWNEPIPSDKELKRLYYKWYRNK